MERIAVFCSASQDIDNIYAEKARELGAWMGDNRKTLVYGGTNSGLMEVIAAEAKAHGAMVMGVVPTIVEERGKTSDLCDVIFRTDNLSDRKDVMLRESEVAIALPGGVGTLDEVFSVMASATIGYHRKQVIFYNINGFWDGVIAFLDGLEKQHFAHLDILFRDGQPQAAVPGGSVYNGVVSLGRMGMDVTFISETGNDKVGQIILDNMRENGVRTDSVNVFPDGKSPVSLAFLNERNDAEYIFYKDYPKLRLDVKMPDIQKDDILMIGSYYAISPLLRDKIKELLDKAKSNEAIIYYDVNFRSNHLSEAIKLMPTVLENFEYADILRGSTEDFQNLFNTGDPDKVYKNNVGFYCKNFICTDADKDIHLYYGKLKKTYGVEPVETVSTIGAGDNFNAGVVYGLIKNNIGKDDLSTLSETDWDKVIRCGIDFSAEVCRSVHNSVSKEFAASYR